MLSVAGRTYRMTPGSLWWASIPKDQWPGNLAADIAPLWDPLYGDRQQELVVIGRGMDAAAVRAVLDTCLLTADELAAGTAAWDLLEDPFVDGAGGVQGGAEKKEGK